MPAGTESTGVGQFSIILPTVAAITGCKVPQEKTIDDEDGFEED
jgi:hypothetical protein